MIPLTSNTQFKSYKRQYIISICFYRLEIFASANESIYLDNVKVVFVAKDRCFLYFNVISYMFRSANPARQAIS